MNSKALHIAKSIFKQDLIARTIYADLLNEEGFNDDFVKLDAGLFDRRATNLYSIYNGFMHNNNSAKFQPFVEKSGFKFTVYGIDLNGNVTNNVIASNVEISKLLKMFAVSDSLFGAGAAKISESLDKMRKLFQKSNDITVQEFQDEFIPTFQQFIDLVKSIKLLSFNSIREFARKLQQKLNKLKEKTMTTEDVKTIVPQFKKMFLDSNLNSIRNITQGKNDVENIFRSQWRQQYAYIKAFYDIYINLIKKGSEAQFELKALEIVNNLEELDVFIGAIKQYIQDNQIIVNEQFAEKLSDGSITSVQKLMQWVQNPKNGWKIYNIRQQGGDAQQENRHEELFKINEKFNSKDTQNILQPLMNMLYNKTSGGGSSKGFAINSVKQAMDFLSEDFILNTNVGNGKSVKDVFDIIKKQCDEILKLGGNRISILHIQKFAQEVIEEKYKEKYAELMSQVDVDSLSAKELKAAKDKAKKEASDFVKSDIEALKEKIATYKELFPKLHSALLAISDSEE